MNANVVAVVDSSACSTFSVAGIPSLVVHVHRDPGLGPCRPYAPVCIRYPPYPPSVPTPPYTEEPYGEAKEAGLAGTGRGKSMLTQQSWC